MVEYAITQYETGFVVVDDHMRDLTPEEREHFNTMLKKAMERVNRKVEDQALALFADAFRQPEPTTIRLNSFGDIEVVRWEHQNDPESFDPRVVKVEHCS